MFAKMAEIVGRVTSLLVGLAFRNLDVAAARYEAAERQAGLAEARNSKGRATRARGPSARTWRLAFSRASPSPWIWWWTSLKPTGLPSTLYPRAPRKPCQESPWPCPRWSRRRRSPSAAGRGGQGRRKPIISSQPARPSNRFRRGVDLAGLARPSDPGRRPGERHHPCRGGRGHPSHHRDRRGNREGPTVQGHTRSPNRKNPPA